MRDGTSRCAAHQQQAWAKPRPVKRMTGRPLQRARAALFARSPLCEPCKAEGRITAATQRDHKVPLAEGGADDPSNEQAICDACHDVKSKAERERGQRRHAVVW